MFSYVFKVLSDNKSKLGIQSNVWMRLQSSWKKYSTCDDAERAGLL